MKHLIDVARFEADPGDGDRSGLWRRNRRQSEAQPR